MAPRGYKIEYTPEVKELMEQRMVLESDIETVMQAYREGGEAIYEAGHRPAHLALPPRQRHLLGEIHGGRRGLRHPQRVQPQDDRRDEVGPWRRRRAITSWTPAGATAASSAASRWLRATPCSAYLDNAFPVELPILPQVRLCVRAGGAGDGQGALCGEGARGQMTERHPGGAGAALRLVELAGLAPPCRIIDLGAGAGETVRRLRALGFDANWHRTSSPGEGVELGDILSSGFEAASFDAALSECAFFLTGDPEGALREAARLLQARRCVALFRHLPRRRGPAAPRRGGCRVRRWRRSQTPRRTGSDIT